MHKPRNLDHLFAQVSKLHSSRGLRAFAETGLHSGQFPLLLLLVEENGRTHSELAAQLHVSPPTVSKTVQRLEANGYVQRMPDPDDERVSRVFITDAGRAVQQLTQGILDDLQADLESVLTQSEQEELYRILFKLREHFVERYEES